MVCSNIPLSLETSGRLIRGCCFFGIYLVCMNSPLSCYRPLPLFEVHASLIVQKPHPSTAGRSIAAPNLGRPTLHSHGSSLYFSEIYFRVDSTRHEDNISFAGGVANISR